MTAESEQDLTLMGPMTPARTGPRHSAPVKQGGRTRIMGLDGPRGLACMCVILVHVGAHYTPLILSNSGIFLLGQAITFFFALSGFLLYLPFIRSILSGSTGPSIKSYTIHRFLRVFPVYIVIFLLANFVLRAVFVENAAVSEKVFSDNGLGMITSPGAFFANLTLVQSFIPSLLQTGINPSWSLSMEFCFYLSLPILGGLALFLRNRRPRWNPMMLALLPAGILFVFGTTGKIAAQLFETSSGITDPLLYTWGPNYVAVVGRSFWALADNFSFGMVAAVIFVAVDNGLLGGRFVSKMRWWLTLLFLPAVAGTLLFTVLHSRFESTLAALASAILVLFIVIPLARGEASLFAEILDYRPIKYLGTISLSLYLWHYPVLIMVGRFGWMGQDSAVGFLRNVVIVVAVTLLFSAITYKFVEAPAMAYARKFKAR